MIPSEEQLMKWTELIWKETKFESTKPSPKEKAKEKDVLSVDKKDILPENAQTQTTAKGTEVQEVRAREEHASNAEMKDICQRNAPNREVEAVKEEEGPASNVDKKVIWPETAQMLRRKKEVEVETEKEKNQTQDLLKESTGEEVPQAQHLSLREETKRKVQDQDHQRSASQEDRAAVAAEVRGGTLSVREVAVLSWREKEESHHPQAQDQDENDSHKSPWIKYVVWVKEVLNL